MILQALAVGCLAAIISGAAIAQPSPVSQTFEVASIKPTPPQPGPGVSADWRVTPGGIHIENQTLKGIIIRAYGIDVFQLAGPAWLLRDDAGWDIEAKAPVNTSPEQIPLMLQTLLIERFKLTSHREKRDVPVYALIVAKGGPKLKGAPTSGGLGGVPASSGTIHMKGNVTMSLLAHFLQNRLDHPVLDMTGLQGPFSVDLEWMPTEVELHAPIGGAEPGDTAVPAASLPAGPTIFTALHEALGLRLKAQRAPIEVLVVDHIEKAPTEN